MADFGFVTLVAPVAREKLGGGAHARDLLTMPSEQVKTYVQQDPLGLLVSWPSVTDAFAGAAPIARASAARRTTLGTRISRASLSAPRRARHRFF